MGIDLAFASMMGLNLSGGIHNCDILSQSEDRVAEIYDAVAMSDEDHCAIW